MTKLFSLATLVLMAMLFFNSVIVDVMAIPTRDKQAVIEELNAYGIDVLDHYPSREPTTADDYYKLGVAYLFRNMPQAAVELFRRAMELNPEHIASLGGLAISMAQLGDLEAALEYSGKAMEIEPDNAGLHNLLGALRMANASSLDHVSEAEESFKRAISLDSGLATSHMNLARLYVSMKKPELATKQYEAVIEIQPESLVAHAELARTYLYSGFLDKAMEEAGKTVEISPQNPVSHNILGEMHKYKGQLDEAFDEFQKAIQLEPTYAPAYNNMGHIYFLKGLPDKAIEHFSEAISYNPNYAEAYANLGEVYISKGMTQEAVNTYRKVANILPNSALISVPVYNNLAYIYATEARDLDIALSYAQRAQQIAPKDPDVIDTIGWIYYQKGDYSKAVQNLKLAVAGSPNNPTIRYHLGAAYYKQGAKEKAATELSMAVKISDKFDGADNAKLLLAELGH